MKLARGLWVLIGFVSLALGTVGIVLPILPTVPFYMLTAFAFAKSSERLHDWFVQTSLYKKHLQSFVEKKGMTVGTKIGILVMVTAVMGFGFIMMSKVPVARIILASVWVGHVLYFIFGVKTIKNDVKGEAIESDEY